MNEVMDDLASIRGNNKQQKPYRLERIEVIYPIPNYR